FKDTKINYFLWNLSIGMAPLIYLYVRSVVQAPFNWRKKDSLHFIAVGLYIGYRIFLYLFDVNQEGFESGYEGVLMQSFHSSYFLPFYEWLSFSFNLLYLAFSFQLYFNYRKKIEAFFSNTYKVELNWLAHFLYIYSFLFVYATICSWVDMIVFELSYKQWWWVNFFSAIAIVYLGIRAYFTDIQKLQGLTFDLDKTAHTPVDLPKEIKEDYLPQQQKIEEYIEEEKVHLNPNLTLKDLAKGTGMSLHDVSEVINSGIGVSFKEYINGFRVEEVKKMLLNTKYDHLSLLAIAYDCGFNSKATFNRVFKAKTGKTPSEYKHSQAA
ncbi:MAG: AraC family transcriptional regulator, partial [Bacteroidota bacterium]